MRELPKGWTSGSLADFIAPRGEKVSPSDFPEMPFIGMDHVEAHTTRIIGAVPSRQMKSRASRFAKGDVLYGRLRPYLNKVAQPQFDGLASGEFIVFGGNKLIDPGFLRYRLHTQDFVNFASHLNEGDRPRVNFHQIGKFEVSVPPTNEQRRIVQKIDALFDEIDQGVASLHEAKKAIGLYRQALLRSAFEGRLTAEWRAQNPDKLEDPEALLQRIRAEREERYRAALDEWERVRAKWSDNGELGKPTKPKRPRTLIDGPTAGSVYGWTNIPLGTLVTDPTYGTSKKCEFAGGITGVLRIPNIKPGRIDPIDMKSANFNDTELAKYALSEGDVLTVRSNGSLDVVGRPAIVEPQHTKYLFAGYLIRLRPIRQSLVPKYLVYLMMTPSVRSQLEAKAKSTSGVNNISARELQELNVPICSPAEQAETVRILDARFAAIETLEKDIEANFSRAEALRQSILKKAFSGKLVPQDPSDEPATALLARTKAERDTTPSKRSPRRTGA